MADRGFPFLHVPLAGNIEAKRDHEIKRFDNTTGVTVTGGATSSITSEIENTPMLKVTTATGTLSEVQFTGMPDITPPIRGQVVWIVYIPDHTKVSSLLGLFGTAGYTAWSQRAYDVTIGSAPIRKRNGWHIIVQNDALDSAAGGFLWESSTVSDMKLRVTPNASMQATMYVHSWRLVPKSCAMNCITFDDAFSGILTPMQTVTVKGVSALHSFKSILDAYGFKATVYVVGSVVGADSDHLTWAQIKSLADAGWDIQVQCDYNAIDGASGGTKLLGPYGYSPKAISSVDTAANTITCTAAHNFNATYPYPIVFSGTDLCAPLVVGTQYWWRISTATAFQVCPTKADAVAGTNIIDLTTTGVPANFTWRHAYATNDDSALIADDKAIIDKIVAEIGVRPVHLAMNQGAIDEYVYSAAKKNGIKTLRGTNGEREFPVILKRELQPLAHPMYMGACQANEPSSAAIAKAFLDNNVLDGGISTTLYHQMDTLARAQSLVYVCDYLEELQRKGLIAVRTMKEIYDLVGA